MREHEASRTLVKSPPELWSECSDAASLARHLGEFAGEIRITRLEPETTVAWEGEHASGTVRIEPSGWGTRVTLTVEEETGAPEEPPALELASPPQRVGALARLKTFFLGERAAEAAALVAPQTPPAQEASPGVTAALDGALESLGQAHHRPYSRA